MFYFVVFYSNSYFVQQIQSEFEIHVTLIDAHKCVEYKRLLLFWSNKATKDRHRMDHSMFEDSGGNDRIWFPCVNGFPLEMMHVVDGGVIKDFMTDFIACAAKATDPVPPGEKPGRRYSIIDTELEEVIQFFIPFSNSDQERKLRYIRNQPLYL